MARDLTPKQRRFVDEYLRGILHRMKVAKAAKAANEAAKRGGR